MATLMPSQCYWYASTYGLTAGVMHLPRIEREVEVEAVNLVGVCEFSTKTATMAMHSILPLSVLPTWFIVSIVVVFPFLVILYFPLSVLPA